MKAGDIIKTMEKSERLIICDQSGKEMFRGFVAMVEYEKEKEWITHEVANTKLHTEIYRRSRTGRYGHKKVMERKSCEEAANIIYQDMEEHIYILIEVA